MYSSINKTKWGVCSTCGGEEQSVVKVKKDLFCLACRNNQKALEQMERVKRKNSARYAAQKVNKLILDNPDVKAPKEYDALDRWYKERRKEMVGICTECGKTTSKHNDKYYRWSVCHIVPKSLIKSVAVNEFNWIELCQQHHREFDNTFDKAAAMMCFGEVKMKFQLFKHLIPAEELRKVNPHLLT